MRRLLLVLVGLLLFSGMTKQWQTNSALIRLSHLAFSSNERVTVTPQIANAIQLVCMQRELNCETVPSFGGAGQRSDLAEIDLVDIVNPIFYPQAKDPLYFLNKPYILMPKDLTIEGNGNFSVSESRATMFGTNYIEFRLYVPYTMHHGLLDISMSVVNSKPPPIEFDIIVQDVVVDTIGFDKGDGSDTTESVQIDLPRGYQRIKILYANDWFDPDKGIDRNAYIRQVTLTSKDSGF